MDDLKMQRISVKLCQLLTDKHKQQRVCLTVLLEEVTNGQNFLSRVITGDVPRFTVMTQKSDRQQSSQWKSLSTKKFIYHDNALTQTSLSVQQFLAATNMAVVSHPPYSPDLALVISSFPRMKQQLKRCCFQNVSKFQEQALTLLHAIPKCQFQRCFQQW
jgi:hypothetical protein